MSDWLTDCAEFHGRALDGKLSHWCFSWDDMPIDETCEEIWTCQCELNIDGKDVWVFDTVRENKVAYPKLCDEPQFDPNEDMPF